MREVIGLHKETCPVCGFIMELTIEPGQTEPPEVMCNPGDPENCANQPYASCPEYKSMLAKCLGRKSEL